MWKIVTLLLIANLQFGCVTTTVGPQGFKTSANMKEVTWTPTSFYAQEISSSVPDNSIWRGANKMVANLATAGIAIAVPGSGAIPAVTRGAGIVIPHITNPPTTVEVPSTR